MGTALEFLGLVGTSLRFIAEENRRFLLEGGGDPERPSVLTRAAAAHCVATGVGASCTEGRPEPFT